MGKKVTKPNYESKYDYYFDESGANRLRTFLGNITEGNPKIYTAPFAKGDSMDKILSDWSETLVSIGKEYPTLLEFENDLASKVGPMSIQLPIRERFDDIAHYYNDVNLASEPVSWEAIKATIQEFSGIGGLRVRGIDRTVKDMKKSTNSGSPFFRKRRDVIQDTIPCETYWTHRKFGPHLEIRRSSRWSGTAVVGWRGQEGGPNETDVKQRVIWMFPFSVNINELQVYQPLIEACQKLNLVPAWVSMDAVDKSVTKLFDTKGTDDLVVCTDFSKFDQHFNYDMQSAAKAILAAILTKGKSASDWLTEVFPVKYDIPLVVGIEDDNLIMYTGEHGMASGSGGTNCDETLTHRALQHEAAILSGEKLNPYSMCLGDDGILSFPNITVDKVIEVYESHGQECNADKQYASTQDCVYLRRWHSTNYRVNGICVGVYSTCRALGRLRYLERWMNPEYWSPELVALRQLSIIENCKWHPLFHEFIEFCMKRDKYRLGIDIPGFLDNITKLAKEATDHIQDFLGYTKTLQGEGPAGIAQWEVVKYLKSKA